MNVLWVYQIRCQLYISVLQKYFVSLNKPLFIIKSMQRNLSQHWFCMTLLMRKQKKYHIFFKNYEGQ